MNLLLNKASFFVIAILSPQLIIAQAPCNCDQEQHNQLYTFIIGLLGGILGVIGGIIVARMNKKTELIKIQEQAKNDEKKNQITALSELMKIIAQANQTMIWLCWQAKNKPHLFKEESINEYDKKMETIFIEMNSKVIIIAGYSKSLYQEITLITKEIYKYDSIISNIGLSISQSNSTNLEHIKKIGSILNELMKLNTEINNSFADKIGIYFLQRERS